MPCAQCTFDKPFTGVFVVSEGRCSFSLCLPRRGASTLAPPSPEGVASTPLATAFLSLPPADSAVRTLLAGRSEPPVALLLFWACAAAMGSEGVSEGVSWAGVTEEGGADPDWPALTCAADAGAASGRAEAAGVAGSCRAAAASGGAEAVLAPAAAEAGTASGGGEAAGPASSSRAAADATLSPVPPARAGSSREILPVNQDMSTWSGLSASRCRSFAGDGSGEMLSDTARSCRHGAWVRQQATIYPMHEHRCISHIDMLAG